MSTLRPMFRLAFLGDPHRLRQVLVNLCGNAVEFTRKGEIRVGVSVAETRDGIASLAFQVRDTGIEDVGEYAGEAFQTLHAGGCLYDAPLRR